MTTDRDIAAALRDAARALRDHADKVHPLNMVRTSYKLGIQDAAYMLTQKADDLDHPDPTTQTTDDLEPWDVPLGEGYEGPSILSTVELPQGRRFIFKRPPAPEPIEYRHTDDGGVERITPHHPSWSPDYGMGLVHGPRLGPVIDMTDGDD